MRAFFIFALLILSSCSRFAKLLENPSRIIPNTEIPTHSSEDIANHLSSLSNLLKGNSEIKFLRISRVNREYLEGVFNRILSNNELLLEKKTEPSFYVISDAAPYIFSLPGYQFFISTGLISKYIKNESLLISAFCFEIIRSGRNLYPSFQVIPKDKMAVPELLSLIKLDYETKVNIYKWSYFSLRRAEYDATAILNWIQTQNKNSLDFGWQIQDARGAIREEFAFKNFIVAQGISSTEQRETNSSKSFYTFLESFR